MRANNEINEEESLQKITNPIVSIGIFEDDTFDQSFSPKKEKDSNSKKNLTKSINGSMIEMVLNFPIIDSSYNYAGNYENYVTNTLSSIILIKKFLQSQNINLGKKFNEKITENKNNKIYNSNDKKILVLDLDETLIHSDFEGKFKLLNNYDAVINFNEDNINYSVGIYLRPGLFDFLKIVKENFDLYIYTASTLSYCNAIINLIDPEKNIFKDILFRNDCININNQIFIKDISIFDKIENVIIVDNSLYSFMNQISNGILINSFYGDKSDMELLNVMNYLIGFLSTAEDVRKINEHFFNFKSIMQEIEKNLICNVPSNNILMNV